MRLALFLPCLTDSFYPRSAVAATKILQHLGHEVVFPQAQTCCGQPHYNAGFHDEARAIARRMIEVFEPFDTVITTSGSCCSMVHEHFGPLLADDPAWAARGNALDAKLHEFTRFLLSTLRTDLRALNARWPGTVTIHYSCHLRGLGITNETERLLSQIDGLEIVPLKRHEQCCGFGGAFASKYPTISGTMVADKVSCIAETKCETVVSSEAGCTMNIEGFARRNGTAVRFASAAEIIAESLGLLERPAQ